MTLHPNWRGILRHAWSARLIITAGILDAFSVILQAFIGAGWFSVTIAVLAGLASAGALISRVVLQANYPVRE